MGYIFGVLFGFLAIGAGLAWRKWILTYYAWLIGRGGPEVQVQLAKYEPARRSGGYVLIAIGAVSLIATLIRGVAALIR